MSQNCTKRMADWVERWLSVDKVFLDLRTEMVNNNVWAGMVGLPVYINVLCDIFPNVSKCSKEINQSDHNSLHSEEMEN